MTVRWYKRLKPRRRAAITAAVLVVFVLFLSFAPTYIALHFIAGTLEDFGIEHEGFESLKINVWKREVWVGPVRFRTGDTDPGQLGELGIKVRLFPVFEKRAMVEKVLARGMELYVERGEDQTLMLNGIPLDQFRPDVDTAEPEHDADPEQAWGTGLVEFEIQDSQLIFKEDTGGTLTVKIEKLRLDNFKSWEPDEPGKVELKASVNGIKIDMAGHARPFAKQITINLDAKTLDGDFAKIIEFTGPIGLEKKAGIYSTSLHHEITLFESGRLDGHSVGQIKVRGADYELIDNIALAAEQVDIELDTRYKLNEKGDLDIDGKFDIALNKINGRLQGKNDFSAKAASLKITKLDSFLGSDKALEIKANPQIDITQASFSGRVQLSMDALLKTLQYLQSISAKKKVSEDDTGLDDWAGEEVILPKSDITIARLHSNAKRVELVTAGGDVSLQLKVDSEASDITVATTDRRADIQSVQSNLADLKLKSGDGNFKVNLNGNNKVAGFNIEGPIGTGSIKSLELEQQVDLEMNKGDIKLSGSAKTGVNTTQFALFKTDILPPASIEIEAINASIKAANFSIANETVLWNLNADSIIEQAEVEFAKDSMTSAKVQRLEVKGAQADQNLNFITDGLTIKGLNASVTRQLIDGVIGGSTSGSGKESDSPAESDEESVALSKKTELPTPQVKLNYFTADGLKLSFRDERVTPQVRFDLDIQTAEVRDVDTRNSKQQSHASIVAKINEFTHLEVKGQADNIGPNLNLTFNGKLEDLELALYSSYAAEFGGVDIDRGQLDSSIDVSAEDGELDGLINLNILDLEFTTLSEADSQRLSNTVGLPIDTAASLLRDSRGNIDLSLPVVGTVVAPSVDISSAITKAIGKTLKTIFPPTLIGSMLMSGKKEGAGLVFEPVIFEPGAKELDEKAFKYLDELAELFVERPSLALKICGMTTPQDYYEITSISLKLPSDAKQEAVEQRKKLLETHGPELLELASLRTQVVRGYLIKDKGLNAKQVGQCRAIFNPDDTGTPRAEIKL